MGKYIRTFKTLTDYQTAISNRELEEAVVSAIIGDDTTVPNIYFPSTRITNEDNTKEMHYNEKDTIEYYNGLEISWKPYGFVVSNVEELGGYFVKPEKMDTLNIPSIYDGYRLYHIDNLTNNIREYINSIGYFDNSNILTASNAFVTHNKNLNFDRRWLTWENLTSVNTLIKSTGSGRWSLGTSEDVIFNFPKVTSFSSIYNQTASDNIFVEDVAYTFNLPLVQSASVRYHGKTKKCTWNLPECTSVSVSNGPNSYVTKDNTLINAPKVEILNLSIPSVYDRFNIEELIPSYKNLNSLSISYSSSDLPSRDMKIGLDLSGRDLPVFTLVCEGDWNRHPNINDFIIDYTNNTETMLDIPVISNATDPVVDWSRVILKPNMFTNCVLNEVPFSIIPYEEGVAKPIYTGCTFRGGGYIDVKSDGIAIDEGDVTSAFPNSNIINSTIELRNFDCFKNLVFPNYNTDDVIWTASLNTKHSFVKFNAGSSNIKIFNVPVINVEPIDQTGWIILNGGDYTGYDTTFDFGTLTQGISTPDEFYIIKSRKTLGALPKLKGKVRINYDTTRTISPNFCDTIFTELNASEFELYQYPGTGGNYFSKYVISFPPTMTKFNMGHVEYGINISNCPNLDITTVEASLLRQRACSYWKKTKRPILRILEKDWNQLSEDCKSNCQLRYTTVDIVVPNT